MPCRSPKAKTSATRHDFSSERKIFSMATYAIESAIRGSTILGDTVTRPYMLRPSVIECATVNALTCNRTERARAAQQENAEHEQHVIESVGHDVGEAE